MAIFHVTELPADTPALDLCDEAGRVRLLPDSAYESCSVASIQKWCVDNARYGLPTAELIAWLRVQIGGRRAIEIGAGAGDLCHHLGILGSDNRCQDFPVVKKFYALLGQPTIRYAPWVETLDALEAIRRYEPQVVVGSWLTHWIDPAVVEETPEGGSVFGIKEDAVLASGATYIMIGNEKIHRLKPIMRLPHETHALPFLRSRSSSPELDRVYIWRGTR